MLTRTMTMTGVALFLVGCGGEGADFTVDQASADGVVGDVIKLSATGTLRGKKGGFGIINAYVADDIVSSVDIVSGSPGTLNDVVDGPATDSTSVLEVAFDSGSVEVTITVEIVCAEVGTTTFQLGYDLFDDTANLYSGGTASDDVTVNCSE